MLNFLEYLGGAGIGRAPEKVRPGTGRRRGGARSRYRPRSGRTLRMDRRTPTTRSDPTGGLQAGTKARNFRGLRA